MFYIILRCLHDEMRDHKISPREYNESVIRLAEIHGIERHGIK